MTATIIIMTFQFTMGTCLLLTCGLHHAVDEALKTVLFSGEEFLDQPSLSEFSWNK